MSGHRSPFTIHSKGRFSVRKVELSTQSEGPDYFTSGEFQVTDRTTGAVVARFPWSLDEAYLANVHYSGPEQVTISDDGTEAIATGDPDGETRIVLPAGAFAVTVDGVSLTDQTDYGAIAARIAEADGPPGATGWREPAGQWLGKLHHRLGNTAAAESLERHISAFLDDPDPRRKAAALLFYYFVTDAPGAARLWELADTRRDLFDLPAPGCSTGRTLDDELVKALSMGFRKGERDQRRVRVMRAEVFKPGRRDDVLIALLDGDAEWVLAQAVEIARADPDRWKDLLYAVHIAGRDERLGSLAAAIVAEKIATRARVTTFARKRFSQATRELLGRSSPPDK